MRIRRTLKGEIAPSPQVKAECWRELALPCDYFAETRIEPVAKALDCRTGDWKQVISTRCHVLVGIVAVPAF